jgi:ATP-dependent Clp protease ATP-binding subunit ClpC
MFERYTEKGRRMIFYARYEASTFGCPEIDTVHLLLGLLREDNGVLNSYLPTPINVGALRARMAEASGKREPVPTTVDLPLNAAATQVLTYAAEEAEALHHAHIGSEHLLLGLLREQDSEAAGILREHGASLEAARRKMAGASPRPASTDPGAEMAGFVQGRGWGAGSARASHSVTLPLPPALTLRLVGEDASVVAEVCWAARTSRLPQIGECLEIEQEGRCTRYRILDIRWQVAHNGTTLTQRGEVLLTVRTEESGESTQDSRPPAPESGKIAT